MIRARAVAASGGLGLVLIALLATLGLGLILKAPCAGGAWTGQQYTKLCYTDIIPLYDTEQLAGGRLPYLQPCAEGMGECDEYPLGTMYAMRLAAGASSSPASFFIANVLLLTLTAVGIAILLYLLVGGRALYFALAPTLAIYAFTNWDLYAVALATGATFLALRGRSTWAGILIGLGVAMKFYPVLLLVPFVMWRFQEEDPDSGIHMAWGAAGAWLAVNLPFAIAAPKGWSHFFLFNAARAPDWDSLWFIGCHRVTGEFACPTSMTKIVGALSAAAFLGAVALAWWRKMHHEPAFPRWQLGFVVLIAFLLTSKVYSPQFGLWLLPWFALVLPDLRYFIPFQVADVAVFVTRFSFFGEFTDVGGLSFGWFEVAIVLRAVVLVACVIAWVRQTPPRIDLQRSRRADVPKDVAAAT